MIQYGRLSVIDKYDGEAVMPACPLFGGKKTEKQKGKWISRVSDVTLGYPLFIDANNEPKSAYARDLGDCHDNKGKLAKRVFTCFWQSDFSTRISQIVQITSIIGNVCLIRISSRYPDRKATAAGRAPDVRQAYRRSGPAWRSWRKARSSGPGLQVPIPVRCCLRSPRRR